METAKTFIHTAILITLAVIALLMIFSEPTQDAAWFKSFLISKTIGFTAFWLLSRLARRWSNRNWLLRNPDSQTD